MVEDVVPWDEIRASDGWSPAVAFGDGARRPSDVYEEWLAATKIAYTQEG